MRLPRHKARIHRAHVMLRGCVLILGLAATAGCPDGVKPTGPTKSERVRVRSFTEASPVRVVAVLPPYLFTAPGAGLDRWDIGSGARLHLSAEHGLPGDVVAAMAADPERGWLWIAPDGGRTRYDIKSATFAEVPRAPSLLGLADFSGVTLAAAGDGGLWIGHKKGLFYTNPAGQWTETAINKPITSLLRSRDGILWIGSKRGLFSRQTDGETYALGLAEGCDVTEVRFIVRAPDGGPLVVGENGNGDQRIVLLIDDNCASFRASPNERWVAASSRAGEVVVLGDRRFYSVRKPGRGARRLRRDGMRLHPVPIGEAAPAKSPYQVRPLDARVPSGARVMATSDKEIFVGTRDLGTARLASHRAIRWLRRSELVDNATSLSVACADRDDCYVATGAPRVWHFDGERFAPVDSGEARVQAVVRGKGGKIYGLRQGEEDSQLLLAELKKGVWLRTSEVVIATPGGRPELSFARFSPSGVLWVGLQFHDDVNELRPYGVALVDIGLEAVAYHHASTDAGEIARGVLPIPINVVDASFLDDTETWLATSEGAARIRGQKVTVFTEDEGLRSEYLRGVACGSGGMVFVASGQGVGIFDGDRWSYPRGLRRSVNALELARDGRLWMATDRGLVVFDGAKVRRLDFRRGLLQNQIDDVVIDHFDRIWVRGSKGLTVVTL